MYQALISRWQCPCDISSTHFTFHDDDALLTYDAVLSHTSTTQVTQKQYASHFTDRCEMTLWFMRMPFWCLNNSFHTRAGSDPGERAGNDRGACAGAPGFQRRVGCDCPSAQYWLCSFHAHRARLWGVFCVSMCVHMFICTRCTTYVCINMYLSEYVFQWIRISVYIYILYGDAYECKYRIYTVSNWM